MTKLISFLLSALLCGLVAIQAKNNISVAEPQRLPVSVTLVQEGSALTKEAAKPLSLKDQKNTMWSDGADVRLMIYEDGAAYLFTANEIFTLEAGDDGVLLKNELYRTPFDAEPAAVLPAGTVKIMAEGDTVELKAVDDPASILTFAGLDGAVLTKEKYTPYRYPDFNFFSGPLEPGTAWFRYFDMGEHHHANLSITVGESGAMAGTRRGPVRCLETKTALPWWMKAERRRRCFSLESGPGWTRIGMIGRGMNWCAWIFSPSSTPCN